MLTHNRLASALNELEEEEGFITSVNTYVNLEVESSVNRHSVKFVFALMMLKCRHHLFRCELQIFSYYICDNGEFLTVQNYINKTRLCRI
jgi:hypothetical protein